MSWSKMGDVPNPIFDTNGDPYAGAVLKAYLSGTTTSTSIAIDSSGTSPQASVTANADGIWEVSGNEIVPHIDRKHKWGIFADSTDAAANTPFYMGPFDNIFQTSEIGGSVSETKNVTTTAVMTADTSAVVGDVFQTAERTTGNGGGGVYDVVLTSSVTPNGYNIIIGVADATISFVLRAHESPIIARQFGVVSDGTTDDILPLQAAIDYANTLGVLSAGAGGAEVHLDEGQTMISNTITLYGGFSGSERVSLIGRGSGTTQIKLMDGSNCDMIKYNSEDGFNHCRIVGILMDGNRANQTQAALTITGITAANPAVVTYTGTQPTNGDLYAVESVSGMTEINELHSTIANVTATTFELDLINSTTFTAYTSGGTATEKFRGIYALKAYSGSKFTDLKINDIAGVAVDCQEVSNGPLMENIGTTRSGTHALWIHDGNNDGFNVINMEVGTAGEDGLGFPYFIYNVAAGGHGHFIFNNIRHDNGGATQTPQSAEMLVVQETAVSILLLSPRVRAASSVSATYNMVRLNRGAAPYIIIHGYGFDSAPSSITRNVIKDTVNSVDHLATTSEPVVYWNSPVQHVDTNSTDLMAKFIKTGDTEPRLAIAPIGPYWGSGSATPDTRIQRDSASNLRVADSSGNEGSWRCKNTTLVDGYIRMDEMSAPTGVADKGFLYLKDNGAGKTQLACKLGDDVEIIIATQA